LIPYIRQAMRHPIRYSSSPLRRIAIVLGISSMLILGSFGECLAGQDSPDVRVPDRAGKVKSPARVDLNTAGIEEISRLPGMTTQTAERIIGNRPYRNLDQLVTSKVVGRKEFSQFRDYVVIGPGKK
jgi:DNA uptake protein ComE-like DNA-binding protein